MTREMIDPIDHQPLVISIAKRFTARGRRIGLGLDDLIAYGQFGLLRACEVYDPGRGTTFATCATLWIRQAICRALQNCCWPIRIPVDLQDALHYGIRPGERRDVAERVLAAGTVGDHQLDGGTLADIVPDPRGEGEDSLRDDREALDAALAELPPRDRDVVRRHHGLGGTAPETYRAIARDYGVGWQRIQAIDARAIGRLRVMVRVREKRRATA